MKKLIISLGLMFVATFALTNCTKNDEPATKPVLNGPKYELYATPAESRTTTDGINSAWADADEINVFHAAAGATDYVSDANFTVDNTTSGHFTGTLDKALTEGTAYDWYLCYPYVSAKDSPAAINKGWTPIGSQSNAVQTQTGNNSTAHLAGSNCPLYAKTTVTYPDPVVATMEHLASVIAVNVTNTEEEAVTVTGISFTAPENIIGTYYINIAETPVVYVASGETYVSKTANLTVTDGEAIANSASAKFYMLIKPFTATSGSTLSITIKTDKGNCTKELTLSSAVTFTAGKIKTLNVKFVAQPEESSFTWDLSIDETATATAAEISWDNDIASMVDTQAEGGTAANNYYPGVPDKSYTSTRFYKTSVLTITPKEGYEIVRVEFTATTTSYATTLGNSTWTNATASVSSTLVTVTPTDGSTAISATIGNTCGFTSVVVVYKATGTTPRIVPNTTSVDVVAAGGDFADITYKLENFETTPTVTVTCDGSVVTEAIDVDGTIMYTVSKNTTSSVHNGWIKLSAEGATDAKITVNQESNLIGHPETVTITKITGTTFQANWTAVKHAATYDWELYQGEDKNGYLVGMGTASTNSIEITLPHDDISVTEFATGKYVLYVNSATADEGYTISEAEATKSDVYEYSAGVTILLQEEFDNSSSSDSSTAITSTTFSNFSGATSKAYKSRYGGIKLGSSSAVGYITSKQLDLSAPFTVQLDACKYGSDTGSIQVIVGDQTKTIANAELGAQGSFTTFTLEFDAATSTSTIKITTTAKRAYIDNVIVSR